MTRALPDIADENVGRAACHHGEGVSGSMPRFLGFLGRMMRMGGHDQGGHGQGPGGEGAR